MASGALNLGTASLMLGTRVDLIASRKLQVCLVINASKTAGRERCLDSRTGSMDHHDKDEQDTALVML
jgi:hypothetical protein